MAIEPQASAEQAQAVFFDGQTAIRRQVTVELAPQTLRIRAQGNLLAEWPYDALETLSAPDDVLRLGKAGNPVLARLEIRDPELAAAIDERSTPVDRTGRIERRLRSKVIFWSLAATASLIGVAVFAVPRIASDLTPLVPYAVERKLGDAIDRQARGSLDVKNAGERFECGTAASARAGGAAFDELVKQLEAAAMLPLSPTIKVVRRSEANAITLPGGHIYVFQGLIEKAETPDELAGVIAHELGHAAHRDGTRTVLEGAGLSLLFGMLLGDFVGGGAVIFAAKKILQTSYSREVERAADAYGVSLMTKVGGDARALAAFLLRIAGSSHSGSKLWADHPDTRDRVAAIEAMAKGGATRQLLSASAWASLKSICSAP